jgi:hypothetical protein
LRFTWAGGPIDTVVTWTLEPTVVGTRFIFQQSGFEGFHAVFVSEILKAGSKKIYGKLLPDLLDRMHDDGSLPEAAADTECDESGSWWKFLARLGGWIFGKESGTRAV